jgi:N utilization substance protein B
MTSNFKPIRKTFARLVVIQSLYAHKLYDDSEFDVKLIAEKLVNQLKNPSFLEEIGFDRAPEVDKSYIKSLLGIVNENSAEIEQVISENLAENWSITKIDNVLLSILKAAVAEILYAREIPTKVIIDEYVTITSGFYEKSEIGFVNGILDKIAKTKRI